MITGSTGSTGSTGRIVGSIINGGLTLGSSGTYGSTGVMITGSIGSTSGSGDGSLGSLVFGGKDRFVSILPPSWEDLLVEALDELLRVLVGRVLVWVVLVVVV